MSPESLNAHQFHKESDVYSFAVLMYELLKEKDFTDKKGFQAVN